MAAEGLITFNELRAKLADLQKMRETAERELEALRNQEEHLEELEKDRHALLGSWAEDGTSCPGEPLQGRTQ